MILQTVVVCLITPIPQDPQRHVGQGRADLPTADMVVGDGDDGTVLVGQVMQRNFIIRAKSKT